MSTPFFLHWPDGSEPLVETFSELTSLDTAYNGTERATIMREKPRYGLSASFLPLSAQEDLELEPLRAGQEVYVPGWMHPTKITPGIVWPPTYVLASGYFTTGWPQQPIPNQAPYWYTSRPGTVYTSRLEATVARTPGQPREGGLWRKNGSTTDAYGIFLDSNPAGENLPAGTTEIWPAIKCRLAGSTLNQELLGRNVSRTRLAFESDEFNPVLPSGSLAQPWGGRSVSGYGTLPYLGVKHNWAGRAEKGAHFSENRFDKGMKADRRIRHVKRVVSVQFDQLNRAEALQLRTFLLALRGRAGRFAWTDFDGVTRAFRLASDTWSMAWRGPGYAQVLLKLVQLP